VITVTALSNSLNADLADLHDQLGDPSTEMGCPERFAAAYLRTSFLRKQTMELDTAATRAKALSTFLNVNNSVGLPTAERHEWEEELYGCFKRHVYNFFYPDGDPLISSWHHVVSRGDLGSGSNIGARGTDFYTKLFDSDLTATSEDLYFLYRRCTATSPTWDDAEQSRLSRGHKVRVVKGNKLDFVPKDDRTSRTIATEPTLNMFFQRGVSNIVEDRLRSFGVDLAIQPVQNRALARQGSMDQSFSTIDLSSASDSISIALVEDVIPRQQRCFFSLPRCTRSTLPDGSDCELNMWSTMGNGYTFTLQTMLFSCMVAAAFEYSNVPRSRGPSKNWGVFGDDIIVPSGAVTRRVLDLLRLTGFTVNGSKTFTEGPFRESCGGDFLHGVNVRPVFAKDWSSRASRYALTNRLREWCGAHGNLPRTLALLCPDRYHVVPPSFPINSGIRADFYSAREHLRFDRNMTAVCRFYSSLAEGITVEEACLNAPRGARQRSYNPGGLMLAFLRGDIECRGGRSVPVMGTRLNRNAFGTRSVSVPNWDWTDQGEEWLSSPRAWVTPPGVKARA
jgi:hypothetical protein